MSDKYYELTISSTNRAALEALVEGRVLINSVSFKKYFEVERIITRCEHGIDLDLDDCNKCEEE